MGLTLLMISELVDRDKGVIVSLKEQANHFEDWFGFVVGGASTNGIRGDGLDQVTAFVPWCPWDQVDSTSATFDDVVSTSFL